MLVNISGGPIWPVRLAYFAAGLFTAASGGTNLTYGSSKGSDLPTSLVWAAVSIAVSIVFALSWPAVIRSIDARQWTRAIMVMIALLITGAYFVPDPLFFALRGWRPLWSSQARRNRGVSARPPPDPCY